MSNHPRPPTDDDVLVVGAGASGLWVARTLARHGLSVTLVEGGTTAGDSPRPFVSGDTHRIQRACYAFRGDTQHLFVRDDEQPYVSASNFHWIRAQAPGGRLHLWGRHALRISTPYLPRLPSEEAWVVSAEELSSHYDALEDVFEVVGERDGIASIPDARHPLAARPFTHVQGSLRDALRGSVPGAQPIVPRLAAGAITRVLSSADDQRITKLDGTLVRRVVMDHGGARAVGIECVVRQTGETRELRGRAVVLSCSALETVRILLASRSAAHPTGIGNARGLLGQGIFDHCVPFVAAEVELHGVPGATLDLPAGHVPMIYMPTFRNRPGEPAAAFTGGYGLVGVAFRSAMLPSGLSSVPEPLRGSFQLANPNTYLLRFSVFGEVRVRRENAMTLEEGTVLDRFGRVIPRIELAYGANESRLTEDAFATIDATLQALPGHVNQVLRAVMPPGLSVHEGGGAPAGNDSATSVCDPDFRPWGVDNLVVADAAAWPSMPFHNPALTIMAVAGCAADRLAARLG